MDKFSINSSTKFTVLEELNSEFTLVKIKVMATGKNRNMSYFDKGVVESHLNSLNYAPVVAHLFKNEDGEYKIGGHDMYIDWEDWSVKSLCVPFGVVKADTFEWETVNEYGADVEYLTCEAILWTGRYPELKETIYSEDVWWAQSMEVDCREYRPLESDSNYIEVLDFEFSALCLLYKSDNRDENVTPCFISAEVTPINFSADDFAIKMNEMKQAMSEVFAFEDKEGENVDRPFLHGMRHIAGNRRIQCGSLFNCRLEFFTGSFRQILPHGVQIKYVFTVKIDVRRNRRAGSAVFHVRDCFDRLIPFLTAHFPFSSLRGLLFRGFCNTIQQNPCQLFHTHFGFSIFT